MKRTMFFQVFCIFLNKERSINHVTSVSWMPGKMHIRWYIISFFGNYIILSHLNGWWSMSRATRVFFVTDWTCNTNKKHCVFSNVLHFSQQGMKHKSCDYCILNAKKNAHLMVYNFLFWKLHNLILSKLMVINEKGHKGIFCDRLDLNTNKKCHVFSNVLHFSQ
jgi:hypothetical protein